MVFFAFAMQCMSTVAVVKRETGGWRWPIIQFAYMTGMAYVCAFLVNQARTTAWLRFSSFFKGTTGSPPGQSPRTPKAS